MDKVLVTGATGFVGANLVRRLLREGYDVHILSRVSSNRWRLADVLSQLHDHTVDLRHEKGLKRLVERIDPDIIFHLANVGVYGGVTAPDRDYIEANFVGTVNLYNACSDVSYRCFVNTGSSTEYGPKIQPMKETDVCEPINMYSVTKCAATLYGSYIAKTEEKPTICLRLFTPFGPYDEKTRLVSYAVVNALRNEDLNLADPKAARDYIYIEDVLDVYLKSVEKASEFRGEVFNVGRGSETAISYIVNKVIELTHSKSKVNWRATGGRAWDSDKWEADIEKTSKTLGWKPAHTIDEGIRKTIDWFRSNLHSLG